MSRLSTDFIVSGIKRTDSSGVVPWVGERAVTARLYSYQERVEFREPLPTKGEWEKLSLYSALIKLKEYQGVLAALQKDAIAALDGEWDKGDEGFETQIESVSYVLGYEPSLDSKG